jgi:hypothetical protein
LTEQLVAGVKGWKYLRFFGPPTGQTQHRQAAVRALAETTNLLSPAIPPGMDER